MLYTFCSWLQPSWWSASSLATSWNIAGASVYGGECGSDGMGYRGDWLPDFPWSFAELDMGSAMGGLPNHTRVRVLSPSTHRRRWLVKRDIGAGGGPVSGHHRSIDLYYPAAHWLADATCTWTGVVLWRLESRREHDQTIRSQHHRKRSARRGGKA